MTPIIQAVFWMTGTLLSFTVMAIAVRELSGEIHSFEIMLFRTIGALIILLPFMLRAGPTVWHTTRLGAQIGRNLVHFAAQLGWITGIGLLSLAEVFAIEFTAPIWASILAILFLGERLNRGRVIALVFGFTGILLILRPGLSVIEFGEFAVLGAAIGFAITLTLTKFLTRTDSPLTILLYMAVVQLPFGIVLAALKWTTPDLLQLFWLLLVGAVGLSAHFCTAKALSLADQTLVVPMDFMRLPLIVLVGWGLYSESTELLVLAGAGLIFLGNYYSIFCENRRKSKPSLTQN
ncbi:MAG: DMT family transporter [Alphaproteobacteria bacterium]|nr:DMT family transporter [Alphaproteobacteria bacterium]